MEFYLKALGKYAEFEGRAERQEYWMFTLIHLLIGGACLLPILYIAAKYQELLFSRGVLAAAFVLVIMYVLYLAATLVPSIAVTVRRLHDSGKSGWLLLPFYVPVVNLAWTLVLLVLLSLDGTPGANQFGENPRGAGA